MSYPEDWDPLSLLAAYSDIPRSPPPPRTVRSLRNSFPGSGLPAPYRNASRFGAPYSRPGRPVRPDRPIPRPPRHLRGRSPVTGAFEFATDSDAEDSREAVVPNQNQTQAQVQQEPVNPIFNDNTLRCPICFDIFNVPKLLTCCGNSICQTCENRITEPRTRLNHNCPVCGTRRSPVMRRSGLPVNITLKNAIEMWRTMGETQGTKITCQECQKQAKPDEVYICATCDPNKKICSNCGLKKHVNHDIKPIGFVSRELREAMVSSIHRSPDQTPFLTQDCDEVKKKFERAFKAINANYAKAKGICSEILSNEHQTEDMVKEKLEEAEKIFKLTTEDYEKINKVKNDLCEVQTLISQDVMARIRNVEP
ncbi:hypothetical protein L596_022271 [Steinernema carpocapsae]|uniref:RING-type domain-containing protein n=1 Tax=Steinernema carpocapsae TaxID=34508 RepID=A0A4U5ML93_STECR|nr:hypothetical protein L596_022271 [Steinernema carpocapsae]